MDSRGAPSWNNLKPHPELAKEEISIIFVEYIEYDYPTFHLSMDCFWCRVQKGNLVLKEAEAAKWLTKEQLDSVEWLPADVTLIEKIREEMEAWH